MSIPMAATHRRRLGSLCHHVAPLPQPLTPSTDASTCTTSPRRGAALRTRPAAGGGGVHYDGGCLASQQAPPCHSEDLLDMGVVAKFDPEAFARDGFWIWEGATPVAIRCCGSATHSYSLNPRGRAGAESVRVYVSPWLPVCVSPCLRSQGY